MAKIHNGGSLGGILKARRLDDVIFEALEKHGDRVCLTNATQATDHTFSCVRQRATRLAVGLGDLLEKRVHNEDVLTLYATNSVDYVLVVLGALRAGLVVNTVNPAATPYELRHYLKIVQPRVIYTETGLLKNVLASIQVLEYKPLIITKERNDNNTSIHIGDVHSKSDDVTRIVRDVARPDDDVACIVFSSGTTGLPKGVMLTHTNAHSQLVMRSHVYHEQRTTIITVFPFYHIAGLLGGLLANIYVGSRYVFFERFHLELFLKSIEKYKPSALTVPPAVMVQMIKSPLVDRYDHSSVTTLHTGAAPTKRETEIAFKRKLNIQTVTQAYGMTESAGRVLWYNRQGSKGQGSCGKVPTGVQLMVVNPSSGAMLGPFSRGELLVRGPMVMKGYIRNPEATRLTIDGQGWLHTGDIAYYDDDGYFFIVDRLKELIKYKGNQVAPAELEALLLEHPAVEDAGVVGVEDLEAGELPRAYVVTKDGCDVSERELQDYVKEHASHYKQLRGGVRFIPQIPRLASGKILRHRLKALSDEEAKAASKL